MFNSASDQTGKHASQPEVSVLIVALDAERFILDTLSMAVDQSFAASRYEIIVVIDPATRDASRSCVQAFTPARPVAIEVVTGARSGLAAGWNLAIQVARAPRVVRFDAHGRYPRDFLERNFEVMASSGQSIVGGPCLPAVQAPDPAGESDHQRRCRRAIGWAEASPLVAISRFRGRGPAGPVNSLARAMYDRRVFERVGGFREFNHHCEDTEAHARMRRAGYQFWYDPNILSHHYVRSTLAGLDRQKFRNGMATTAFALTCPGCFRPGHLVPAGFVAGFGLVALPGLFSPSWAWLSVVYASAYMLAVLVVLARWSRSPNFLELCRELEGSMHDARDLVYTAAIVARIHVVFGLGGWWGVLRHRTTAAAPAVSLDLRPPGEQSPADR